MRFDGVTGARAIVALLAILLMAATVFLVAGCGSGESTEVGPERPESVTAYQAVEFTKPKADYWQKENWMILVRDGGSEGVSRDGKAEVWEIYYFSPRPEEKGQLNVMYNRGEAWPSAPGENKGGQDGRKIYTEEKPPDFRVDSGEAVTAAMRNGGGEYLDGHPDAERHVTLRCKADYDAVGEAMPAPKYNWIWDVSFKEPKAGSEVLHVFVDGMSGEFIAKDIVTPP
jgi:hypothetical protein